MKTLLLKHKKELNRFAELGWQEFKTTNYLLKTIPFKPYKIGFRKSKTGLLYRLGNGTEAILLRADIDALRTNSGPTHICGHSSHTAGLLQALLDAIQNIKRFPKDKSVYFLFQPAEETYPSGAASFMAECPEIVSQLKYAFATHVRPLMKIGQFGLQPGPVMARGDYFEVSIKGRMSHVKNALAGVDAIEAAAYLITAIKKYQKRRYRHVRLNVGVVQGGLQSNTVADYCLLKGDVRLDDDRLQNSVKVWLNRIIKRVEKATDAAIELRYFDGYPVLSNNRNLTKTVSGLFDKQGGVSLVYRELFSFGCEDFSFISHAVPSVYAFIGTGDRHDIHDEKCTISDAGTIQIYRYFSKLISWWVSS